MKGQKTQYLATLLEAVDPLPGGQPWPKCRTGVTPVLSINEGAGCYSPTTKQSFTVSETFKGCNSVLHSNMCIIITWPHTATATTHTELYTFQKNNKKKRSHNFRSPKFCVKKIKTKFFGCYTLLKGCYISLHLKGREYKKKDPTHVLQAVNFVFLKIPDI